MPDFGTTAIVAAIKRPLGLCQASQGRLTEFRHQHSGRYDLLRKMVDEDVTKGSIRKQLWFQ